MNERHFFRCRYDIYHNSDQTPHDEICGIFRIRIPASDAKSKSRFGPKIRFQYDSGSELSVMSKQFAEDYGLANSERDSLGECWLRGFDHSVPARKAWQVPLWVRFHHHRPPPHHAPHLMDGIPNWEFRFLFLIVDDATMECPLLGVNDMHRFFFMASRKDQYYYFMRFPDDDDLPRNWNPVTTPKRVRPIDQQKLEN